MRRLTLLLVSVTSLLLGLAACSADSDSILAPPPPLFQEGNGSLLLSCTPLRSETVSFKVGPDGGTWKFGPHSMAIPKGALSKTVTIKAEVISDRVNSVRFSPEGLNFSKGGVQLTLSYANCFGVGMLLPKLVAYTDEQLSILYLLQSVDNVFQKKVTAQLQHFSRYAVAF